MWTHTKIVCTIGPAVSTYEKMVELVEAGMNVARLNFSHGSHEEHLDRIVNLKKVREDLGRPLAIMIDTKGPEIRVGKVAEDALIVQPGMRFRLVQERKEPTDIPIHPIEVLDCLHVDMRILFDDGYIQSKVVEITPQGIVIEILNMGLLKSGKGVNIPDAHIPLPAMTPQDIEDLKFACKHDVDIIAASFIRSSHNVLAIKEMLAREGNPGILVVAKIENHQGVDNFDSIVQVADGIMIARGDLGVEVNLAEVPKLQKMMIRKCFQAAKPAVTSTQMLESMISNPRPTRAEVSDVANAIYDGSSAIMLSGETAIGKYPIEAVQRMKEIAQVAEADYNYRVFFEEHTKKDYHDVSSSVALAAVKTAYSSNSKAIFAFTTSGATPRLLSRLRPGMPILALTPHRKIYHQLAFNWGVIPVCMESCNNAKDAFCASSEFALKHKLISFGDLVVITAGTPFGKKGTTNMMLVESIGEVLVRGHRGLGQKVSGKVAFLLSPEESNPEDLQGKLVVINHCDYVFLHALKDAAGLILQNYLGDEASEKYATLVAKTFDIPVMTRADGAMLVLKEGEEVTLDPQRGIVYRGTEENPICPSSFLS